MRVLHVNAIAKFTGGVERILFDSALGLKQAGDAQGLLYLSGEPQPEMLTAFDFVTNSVSEIDTFSPDIVLIHKAEHEVIAELCQRFSCVRMVHDHDVVCLRRHKYFPVSKRVCNKPAGFSCLTHGCFIQPDNDGLIPIKFASLTDHLTGMDINRGLKGFIVGSKWMADSLIMNGFAPEKIQIIPPVPLSLAEIQLPDEIIPSDRVVLFVGQLIRGKGIDLMLRSLAQLQGEWRAIFAGEGNFRKAAEDMAAQLGIAHKTDFVGRVDHSKLDYYYQTARCVVVPSRWPEPFGMVGIEAQARGKAVVAFDVGGIPDWLENNLNGCLVPAGDAVGMAIAVQKLLDNPDLAETLGHQGTEYVENHFKHSQYMDSLKKFLEQYK